MFIPNEFKKIEKVEHISDIRESFFYILSKVVEDFIVDKSMFSMDNFSATYYDEFTLETNCHKDIFNTIYLEINQPLNYKLLDKKISKKSKSKKTEKLRFPELYINIDTVLQSLFELFIQNLDANNIVWLDEYSVNIKSTISDDNNQVINYYFKIIPGITYHNKDNINGIMYQKNGGIEIEYPRLSIEKFNDKNTKTKGKYRDLILIIKNILLQNKEIESLPKEIIEILLYNVPNSMFKSESKATIINIMNFIRNNNIKNFKTLDEQDLAFTSIYRSMSQYYVKHIIKLIEKYLANN